MSTYRAVNRRILIVDDNEAIHSDFRKILADSESDNGLNADEMVLFGEATSVQQCPTFELDHAHQGKEAVKMVAEGLATGKPFAVAFVDMRMPPGWDGVKTIRRLWEIDNDLHVVICTAYSDYSSGQIIESLGETDRLIMVKKPFEPEEVLLATVSMTCKWEQARQANATKCELQAEVSLRTDEVTHARDMLAFSLARLAESRDPETGEHLERMRHYAMILSEYLAENGPYKDEIDSAFLEDLYRSSPLHDIGKVGIPDNVLLKPGKLTDEEFEIMKSHARIGADTLKSTMCQSDSGSFLRMATDIAEYHHERFNGTGYPAGLKGVQIPLAARIVALADVFDALTSDRVYKTAIPSEQAKEIILRERNEHFDPVVVDAFIDCYDKFLAVLNELGSHNKSQSAPMDLPASSQPANSACPA